MFDAKRILQINSRAVYIALVIVILTITCQAHAKATVLPIEVLATAKPDRFEANFFSKIRFSSVFTKLDSKTCQPAWKAESDEEEVPLICAGFKGYKIFVAEHGVMPPIYIGREISTDMDSWDASLLPSFTANRAGNGQVIEWRLADGEPFACIVRAAYEKRIIDPDDKGVVNELVVKNLKGFAPINISVDASKNKRANKEARRQADAGYRKL